MSLLPDAKLSLNKRIRYMLSSLQYYLEKIFHPLGSRTPNLKNDDSTANRGVLLELDENLQLQEDELDFNVHFNSDSDVTDCNGGARIKLDNGDNIDG